MPFCKSLRLWLVVGCLHLHTWLILLTSVQGNCVYNISKENWDLDLTPWQNAIIQKKDPVSNYTIKYTVCEEKVYCEYKYKGQLKTSESAMAIVYYNDESNECKSVAFWDHLTPNSNNRYDTQYYYDSNTNSTILQYYYKNNITRIIWQCSQNKTLTNGSTSERFSMRMIHGYAMYDLTIESNDLCNQFFTETGSVSSIISTRSTASSTTIGEEEITNATNTISLEWVWDTIESESSYMVQFVAWTIAMGLFIFSNCCVFCRNHASSANEIEWEMIHGKNNKNNKNNKNTKNGKNNKNNNNQISSSNGACTCDFLPRGSHYKIFSTIFAIVNMYVDIKYIDCLMSNSCFIVGGIVYACGTIFGVLVNIYFLIKIIKYEMKFETHGRHNEMKKNQKYKGKWSSLIASVTPTPNAATPDAATPESPRDIAKWTKSIDFYQNEYSSENYQNTDKKDTLIELKQTPHHKLSQFSVESQSFIAWYWKYTYIGSLVCLLSILDIKLLSLLTSNLFGLKAFNAPIRLVSEIRISMYRLASVIVENIPQLTVQIAAFSMMGWSDSSSNSLTILPFIYSVIKMVIATIDAIGWALIVNVSYDARHERETTQFWDEMQSNKHNADFDGTVTYDYQRMDNRQ